MKQLIQNPNNYTITPEGVVLSNKYKRPLSLQYDRGGNPFYQIKRLGGGSRQQLYQNKLLPQHYPFYWINQLEEGEECRNITYIYQHPMPPYKYFITNRGRVWSNISNRFLETQHNYGRGGYYDRITIDTHSVNTHWLVGRYFLENWYAGCFVCHRCETLPYPNRNYPTNLWVGNNSSNQLDSESKQRTLHRRKRVSECMRGNQNWRGKHK
ncbi:hypothetical protein Syn7803C11_233 [Synechococcus phage ACG-2014f]|uniref:Uncharacterized protein n=1 Tax=Synechococcus phage ACG-2014f TaxID=1493511 RepID=A0A0E3G1T1_9CAUD|nr:hypothetical protein Syn7803C11_233 [Synechococcus phage ACG-2014f]